MAPPFRGRALRRPGAAGGAPSTWRPCATGQDPPNVGGGGGGGWGSRLAHLALPRRGATALPSQTAAPEVMLGFLPPDLLGRLRPRGGQRRGLWPVLRGFLRLALPPRPSPARPLRG